jgi:hypothetical protein
VASSPSSLACFYFKDAPAAQPGVSAPDLKALLSKGQHPSAAGSMNHVAFNVPDEEALGRYRKRIINAASSSTGLVGYVSPIVFHADTEVGFTADRHDGTVSFVSFYFFGPDGEMLEFTSQPLPSPGDRDDAVKGVGHMPSRALWRL